MDAAIMHQSTSDSPMTNGNMEESNVGIKGRDLGGRLVTTIMERYPLDESWPKQNEKVNWPRTAELSIDSYGSISILTFQTWEGYSHSDDCCV